MVRYKNPAALALCISVFMCTGCSFPDLIPEPASQPYSEIRNPYTDKAEIDHHSENIYKRTAAGTLKYIDDGNKAGIKKMLCKGLNDMKDTDAKIDAMLAGFKGDIKDTTYISGDLEAGSETRWSKTDAVAYYESEFYVYTNQETYSVKLDMCAVNDRDPNGKDSVGVTRLHLMTLDKKYEAGKTDAGEYSILSGYGNSGGYEVLNTSKVWSDNDVWKLTGTKDSISQEDLKKIDYSDEDAVRKVFNGLEQYAVTNSDPHCRLYNLSGSEKKVHVYSDNYDDGDDSYKVKFVRIIDISELFGKQAEEYIYNYKNNKKK